MHDDPYEFDIDVDLAPLLGRVKTPVLIDARWYELASRRPDRPEALQHKLDGALRKMVWAAQWRTTQAQPERRRAPRAPLLSRVHTPLGRHLIACDISRSGLRASGYPQSGLLDVEFKLPGLHFPVDARAEVVSFKHGSVLPLAGLRFVDIDPAYLEHIDRYIHRRLPYRPSPPLRLAA